MNSLVNSGNKFHSFKKVIKKIPARLDRAGIFGWLYLLPAIILVGTIIIYPLIINIRNSVSTDLQLLAGGDLSFVGLDNYRSAWNAGLLQQSVKNTLIFTFSSVIFSFIIGFAIALLLDRIKRGATVYRLLLVTPWVISPVITGFAWRWMLSERFGFLNYYLLKLGIISDNIIWLGDTTKAFTAVIVANIWRSVPFMIIMLLAGLKGTSKELEEAADIDGAGVWQKFWFIIIPQMKNVIIIVMLLGLIWSSNDFTLVQIMTKGGPLNSTMVLPVLIKNTGFFSLRYGTASALSVILVIILLIFSIIYLRVVRRSSD